MTSSTDSSEYESSSEETESSVSLSPAKRSKPRKSVKKAKKGKSHKAKKAKSSKHAKTAKTKKSKRKKEKKSRKEQTTDPGGDGSRKEKTTGWGGDDSWSAWSSASWGRHGSGGSRGWKSGEKDAARGWKSGETDAADSKGDWSAGSWQGWKQKQSWPKPAAKAQIQHPGAGGGDDRKRRWGQDPAPDAWTDYWQIARQNNENDEWRVQCPAGARDEGIVPVLLTPDENEIARFADEVLASFQAPRSMLEAVLRAMMQGGVNCPMINGVPGIFQVRGEGWGHLVIPLVEQDTEAPLQSPMHRELLESDTHHYSFAHGTSQYALPMILMERIIRPQNYKKDSIPTVGPFGVASPGHLSMSPDCSTLRTILKRSRSISKGQQSSTLLCEVRAPEQHVRLDAGTGEQLQISCRDAGVAVGPDAAVARSDLTYILGVAITYPF